MNRFVINLHAMEKSPTLGEDREGRGR